MHADVTNRSRGARGLQTAAGTTHLLDPGATARLDLADHPLHRAWEAEGEIVIVEVRVETPASPRPPRSPEVPSPARREGGAKRRGRASDATEAN